MHKPERYENASFSRFYMESEVAKNTSNSRLLTISLPSNSATIKQLLQQQIMAAMASSSRGIAAANLPKGIELTSETIPLYRLLDDSYVMYRSAIAFKLASLLQLPAIKIANQLATSFPTINQETACQMCLDFKVEVVFPGWINFRLSDRTLATWLQQLIQPSPITDEEKYTSPSSSPASPAPSSSSKTLFLAKYAHARCCSLLRLAHWQELIKLRDLEFKTSQGQFIEPNPIPWLIEEGADIGQITLRLVHPAERCLIVQLLDVQDAIADPSQLNAVKFATALSDSFEEFYRSCRIWGDVKTQTPKLAQARLGLVGVTQVSLRSLLQDHLGIPAPIAL